MSEMKIILNAVEQGFIKFTDRAVGKRFKDALTILDDDLTDEEYEPSPAAVDAYKALAQEIEDATLEPDDEPTSATIVEAEKIVLEEVEEDEPEVTERIDSKDLEDDTLSDE
jgi:hypothetical protein